MVYTLPICSEPARVLRHTGGGAAKIKRKRKDDAGKTVVERVIETHLFQTAIVNRTRALDAGSRYAGCSICSGRTAAQNGSLCDLFPNLALEWLETENGKSAFQASVRSSKLAFWRCQCGHNFAMKISACTRKENRLGCPECSDGEKISLYDHSYRPALGLFDRTRNNRGFKLHSLPSQHQVFWRCPDQTEHLWYESINDLQEGGFLCPKCHPKRDRIDLRHYKELSEQFDVKANNLSVSSLALRSAIHWTCDKGSDHKWTASLYHRLVNKTGCPFCSGRKASNSNSLANFDVASEFHPIKNGKLKPEDFPSGSSRRVYWLCECGHSWPTQVRVRTRLGCGCPKCKRKKKTTTQAQ